jgi:hypothetical protein
MLQIGLLIAWLIALSLAIHLATQAIKARLLSRREKKHALRTAREFRKNHHFDPKQKRWVRNVDRVPLIDHSAEDRRIFLIVIGCLLFILWEGYWVLEIREQYVAKGRLELPYVFLFFMLVGIPFALYLFLRRKLRRAAIIPVDQQR